MAGPPLILSPGLSPPIQSHIPSLTPIIPQTISSPSSLSSSVSNDTQRKEDNITTAPTRIGLYDMDHLAYMTYGTLYIIGLGM